MPAASHWQAATHAAGVSWTFLKEPPCHRVEENHGKSRHGVDNLMFVGGHFMPQYHKRYHLHRIHFIRYLPIVAHLNISHHIINVPIFSPNITVVKPVDTSDTCDFRTLVPRRPFDLGKDADVSDQFVPFRASYCEPLHSQSCD